MTTYEPHRCDFCPGTVRPLITRNEPIRISGRVVLLDGPTIGRCDRCGHRYYPADVVRIADRLAEHPEQAPRTVSVPVASV